LIATYVSLQNRALLAEMRQGLAEIESRMALRLKGMYGRRPEWELHKRAAYGTDRRDCTAEQRSRQRRRLAAEGRLGGY